MAANTDEPVCARIYAALTSTVNADNKSLPNSGYGQPSTAENETPGSQLVPLQLSSCPAEVSQAILVKNTSGNQVQKDIAHTVSQQVNSGDSGSVSEKRKRKFDRKDHDDGAPPNKHMRTTTYATSIKTLGNTVPHGNGVVKSDRNAVRKVLKNSGHQVAKVSSGLLLDFLFDVPGWGPDRAAPTTDESIDIGKGEGDLESSLDDLFEFDRYYAS